MNIDSKTGIWMDADRHRIYDQPLAECIVALCQEKGFPTVADLGCGAGFYVQHLRDGGIDCAGFDGNPHTPEITENKCGVLDLSQPIDIGTKSCVVSLEVGEHIPQEFQSVYIGNLLKTAEDYLILSWAIPGQGGLGHYNERPQEEIVGCVAAGGGWSLDTDATFRLRNASTLPWFKNTILCFERVGNREDGPVTGIRRMTQALARTRELSNDMYMGRIKEYPVALTIPFWEKHPRTMEALECTTAGSHVLDFGCGSGEIAIVLGREGRNVAGCDISPVGIELARKHLAEEAEDVRQRVNFSRLENVLLPYAGGEFDTVFCAHVLEQVPHLTPVLKELARVLKPGGDLVVLSAMGTAHYDVSRVNFFDADTLRERLSDFFESVDVSAAADGSHLKAVCSNPTATRHARIVCMMRIRNEERWIKEVMDSIARVCDGIVIVDDGSSDHTPEICAFHPAVVDYHWQKEPVTDQRRDKDLALQMAIAQEPDWILALDADEALESTAAPRIFEAIRHCPEDVVILKIHSLFMWNDMRHYRSDGIYERIYQERLFRVAGQELSQVHYLPTKFNGNGHCTRHPGGLIGSEMEIDVKILHVGYMYPEVRARRYEYYRKRDPKEFATGYYNHLLDQSHQNIEEWTERPFVRGSRDSNVLTAVSRATETVSRMAVSEAEPPEVSVIIPVFNNLQYTAQCLKSLFEVGETVPFEVIVVNNGSSDGTKEYLKQLPPPIRTITLPDNVGFAKGCNAGTRVARGRYVVFLNNDTVVQRGWLSSMLNCAESDDTIGLVGNLQIFPETGKVQQAGIVCGPDKMVRSLYNNELPADHPAVNRAREFQFVAGSCMLIEKEFFAQLEMFDERYQNSCEDVDLCMKVREAGRKVYYCPQSRIFHFESKTVSGHDKNGRNYQMFLERWADKMVQDDFRYLREDGFLKDAAEPAVEPKKETKMEERATPVAAPLSAETARAPKVAILTTYNQHCGLSTYAEYLVTALREQGTDPLILAEKTSDRRAADDSRVIRCWTRDARGGDELASVIARHGIEVLHVNHGGMFGLEGWLTAVLATLREMGVRIITTFHSADSITPVLGNVARLSDRVLVHHPQCEVELVAEGGPIGRTEVVPMGMPPLVREDIFEAKLKLGLNPAQKVISTFGFVERHKGILEIIEAMKPVFDRTGAHLHVLGGPHPANPDSVKYLEECKRKAVEYGMEHAVLFSNEFIPDDEVARQLRASDVIVMNYQSQRYESSFAAMIALASGRPIVSSSAPPFDLPVEISMKVTESFDLGQAIYTLLLNPFARRLLLNNALEYEKLARWDVVAKRIAAVYGEVSAAPAEDDVDLLGNYRGHPDDIYADTLQRERVRWLKSKSEGRILEIGPATGYVSEFVGAAEAVDIHRGRLAVCRVLRPATRFEFGNVVSGLPYADKEFDQVHAPEILEHVDFEQAVIALKECMRVGKRVLATLPNADKPDYDPVLVHNVEHRWLVNRQMVDRLLREAGATSYELDASQTLDFYLLDILSAATTPNARIHERAAFLTSINVDPGEPIRVAVDCSALEEPSGHQRGIDRYMVDHFTALMKVRPHWQFTFFGVAPVPQSEALSQLAAMATGGYAGWTDFDKRVTDVLYLPYPMGPIASELMKSELPEQTLVACTMHDVVPLVYADAYLKPNPATQEMYISQLRRLRERCDLFFCGSQTTLQELQVHAQLSQAKMRIIHGAASELFASEPSPLNSQATLERLGLDHCEFLLAVGAPDFCRNATGMYLALASAQRQRNEELSLVIAGEVSDPLLKALNRLEQQCGLRPGSVLFTGPVSDDDLNVLYHNATALLHPSLYEGYNGALLDAMAAGLPVIAGNNSAQTELVGEAGLMVDPRKTEEIARAITSLYGDSELRLEVIERGMEQTRHFTWTKAAEKTAIYLSEAVALKARHAQGKLAARRSEFSTV